nr:zinc finger, CCHC-type [Tanacetum cinerariifolium]
MDESIFVSSVIDKLPPSWKDFKHTLKAGKDDLSLVQLGSQLHIEESLRAQDSDNGKDRCWFKTYEPVEDGSVVYMGDDHFAPVHGKGTCVVPKLRKNLVSSPMLNKCGYKQLPPPTLYIPSRRYASPPSITTLMAETGAARYDLHVVQLAYKSVPFLLTITLESVRCHVQAIRMLPVRIEAAVVEMR